MSRPSCLSEVTVEPVLFLYMLATFSQYALYQDLVYTKVCASKFNSSVCNNLNHTENTDQLSEVQTASSHWILFSTIAMVLPSLLIAAYLGSWSDKFGRKWPVVIPPFGGALSCGTYILISFWKDSPLGLIPFAASLAGFSGGFVSCIMSCMTYVAAVSSEESRTVRISRLEAMTFLGGTIGPFVAGSMFQVTGHGYAFCMMTMYYILAVVYSILFVEDISHGEFAPLQGNGGGKRQKTRASSTSTTTTGVEDEDFANSAVNQGNMANAESPRAISPLPSSKLLPDKEDAPSSRSSITNNCIGAYPPREIIDSGDNRQNSSASSWEDSLASISAYQRDGGRKAAKVRGNSNSSSHASCCSTYFGSEHFTEAVMTAFKKRQENRRLFILLVIIASYITMTVSAGELDVAYLFAKDQPLLWGYQTYSYYFGMKYGVGALSLLIGMPLLQTFGFQDTTICIIGIVSRMIGLVVYGLSTSTIMAFTVPLWAIFSFFSMPATRALLSKLVCSSEHGLTLRSQNKWRKCSRKSKRPVVVPSHTSQRFNLL